MRLGQYRVFAQPPWVDRSTGESCDVCGCQLKDEPADGPCPIPGCGSTVRRLPRRKGQAVADVVDVAEVRA